MSDRHVNWALSPEMLVANDRKAVTIDSRLRVEPPPFLRRKKAKKGLKSTRFMEESRDYRRCRAQPLPLAVRQHRKFCPFAGFSGVVGLPTFKIKEIVVTDTLNVENREETGTLRMRRLRAAGKIPAVLYGLGKGTVSLSVPASELNAAIRHGSHVLQLKGAVNESALLKHVQWAPLGDDILHLDLTRFNAKEEIEVALHVELRGDAPGSKEGGIVNQLVHELTVSCLASDLPEVLEIDINGLELNGSISIADLKLADGVTVVGDPSSVIVTCTEAVATPEPTEDEASDGPAEPEVIGQKADESAEDGDDS